MKVIGIVLMFLFCTALGGYYAYLQHIIGKNSRMLLEAMNKAKMLLRYSRPDKSELLEEISFNYFTDCNTNVTIDSQMYSTAEAYFNEMGSRDYNSETDSLNYSLEMLKDRLKTVSKSCGQNQKLYLSLGVIAGLFFVIVFI